MGKLDIHLCPETAICSIVKEDGKKIDLMPDEVEQLRQASGDCQKQKEILGNVDASFSGDLATEELDQLSQEIK